MFMTMETADGVRRLALRYEKALKRIARIKEATGAGQYAINAADKIAQDALRPPQRTATKRRGR